MGFFRFGRLHKEVRRAARTTHMFTYLWVVVPDRRQLLHKGRKP